MNTGALQVDANGHPVPFPSGFTMQSGGDIVEVEYAELVSNVAKIYTSEDESFQVGQQVQVTLNPVPVEKTLTDMAIATNVVTCHTSGNHGFLAGDTAAIQCDLFRVITAISSTGALTTFTTGATPHGFAVGDTVELYFDDGTENWGEIYQGTHVITAVPSSTTFKIALTTQAFSSHASIGFGTARVSISGEFTVASASTNVFTFALTRPDFTTFTFGATEGDTVIFTAEDIYSGIHTITSSNSTERGFNFALTHANRAYRAWTGLAVGYFESPVSSGDDVVPLIFPENAFRLRIKPVSDAMTLMVVSDGSSGGTATIPSGAFFEVPGKAGDIVYIARDTGADSFEFIFDTMAG